MLELRLEKRLGPLRCLVGRQRCGMMVPVSTLYVSIAGRSTAQRTGVSTVSKTRSAPRLLLEWLVCDECDASGMGCDRRPQTRSPHFFGACGRQNGRELRTDETRKKVKVAPSAQYNFRGAGPQTQPASIRQQP